LLVESSISFGGTEISAYTLYTKGCTLLKFWKYTIRKKLEQAGRIQTIATYLFHNKNTIETIYVIEKVKYYNLQVS